MSCPMIIKRYAPNGFCAYCLLLRDHDLINAFGPIIVLVLKGVDDGLVLSLSFLPVAQLAGDLTAADILPDRDIQIASPTRQLYPALY